MKINRSCGILAHISSLPSIFGIGDLGEGAYNFIDFLTESGQKYWQILPLNPVSEDGSPYQTFSAFAGNPYFIDPLSLLNQGFLQQNDFNTRPDFLEDKVEFKKVETYKLFILRKAFENFRQCDPPEGYHTFLEDNKYWLDHFSTFMAFKAYFGGKPWFQWDDAIAFRAPHQVTQLKLKLAQDIAFYKFVQFIFFRQWEQVRQYAHRGGIKIIGDLPIFISHDSCDVWINPGFFQLDELGYPENVAGVPPDYFSLTGQLWGNPLYRWAEMERDGFSWWRERFRQLLRMVDVIRIDHFRGFEAYWAVPAGEKTAEKGKWVKGPGKRLFLQLEKDLGVLPVIVENLGVITPEVIRMQKDLKYPGMEILQFSWESGRKEKFLPFSYKNDCILYTGTHDNDTLLGWYRQIGEKNPALARRMRKSLNLEKMSEKEICWKLIEFAYQTNASLVIIPIQDAIGLGSEGRMNYPGRSGGNWQWRFTRECLTGKMPGRLMGMAVRWGR